MSYVVCRLVEFEAVAWDWEYCSRFILYLYIYIVTVARLVIGATVERPMLDAGC